MGDRNFPASQNNPNLFRPTLFLAAKWEPGRFSESLEND